MNRLESRISKLENKSPMEDFKVVTVYDGETKEDVFEREGITPDDNVICIQHKMIYGPEDLNNDS